MPFKTQYGSHYHETYGCHGATIPCDTSGLAPCSDCCGANGGGVGAGGSGSVVTEDGERLAYEDLAALGADGVDVVLSAETLSTIVEDGDFESYLALAVTGSTEVIVDDVQEVTRNADGSVTFRVRGEYTGTRADYAEAGADDDTGRPSPADRISKLAEAGRRISGNEASLPREATQADVADALARHLGVPAAPSTPEAVRGVLSAAGIPEDVPAVVEGRTPAGALLVATRHVSTTSHSRPNGTRGGGEWLYESRTLHVIAPDGRDLTDEVKAAKREMEEIDADENALREAAERAALRLAEEQVPTPDASDADAAEAEALRRVDETVRQWNDGYEAWKASPETQDQARQMAERMKANRPAWRHRYIDGDVEDRLRDRYSRRHPEPDARRLRMAAREAAARERHAADRRRHEEVLRRQEAIMASEDESWKPSAIERDGRRVTAEGVAAARRSHAIRHSELHRLGLGGVIGMSLEYDAEFGQKEVLSRRFADMARKAKIDLDGGDGYPMDVAGPDLRL